MRIQEERYTPSREIMAESVRDIIRWALEDLITLEDLGECIDELVEQEGRGVYPQYWIATPNVPRERNASFSFKEVGFLLGATGVAEVAVLASSKDDVHTITLTRGADFEIYGSEAEIEDEVVRSVYATL